jgi:hypothetical protein
VAPEPDEESDSDSECGSNDLKANVETLPPMPTNNGVLSTMHAHSGYKSAACCLSSPTNSADKPVIGAVNSLHVQQCFSPLRREV